MRLPFTNEEYKDKPVALSWRHKPTRSRIVSKRFLSTALGLILCLYFFWRRTASTEIHGFHSIYQDEDLRVHQSWYSASMIASLAIAQRDKLARGTENVFFFLNGLTDSDTNLVSLGCQMSMAEQGAMVHFIILGGGVASVDNYRQVNQFEQDTCQAFFHDARDPDVVFDDPARAYASFAFNAMQHIVFNQNPKAVIFTHSKMIPKPNWFLAAVEPHRPFVSIIELAHESVQQLEWMASLSPRSLNAWNRPRIDVILDVSTHAGTLKILLESLASAKYPADRLPLLLVNLAASTTQAVHDLVDELSRTWPSDKLLLRRFKSSDTSLESWYPVNDDHYALFLQDTSELAPCYFQYLLDTILRYKYGSPGRLGPVVADKVYGITLQTSDVTDTSLRNMPLWYDTLIYPHHYIAFHKASIEWSAYIKEHRAVVIAAPHFVQGGHSAFLVKAPHTESTDPTQPITADADVDRTLLTRDDWWLASPPQAALDKVPLYTHDNDRISILEFFKDEDMVT